LLEILPIKLPVKEDEFDVYHTLVQSGFAFKEQDIIIISSKYVSVSEGSTIDLKNVRVGNKAKLLAMRYHMDKRIVELVLREADYIVSGIPGFLLCIKDGVLAPNAGIDKSNIPHGAVVLYPHDPFATARKLRLRFLVDSGVNIGIVIADSRLMPTRVGTTGVAIAVDGFEPVEDQRGQVDLFGNVLRVTTKAVADGLAAMGVLVMGEADESTPVVVVRGFKAKYTDRPLSWRDTAIEPEQDIFVRRF